MLGAVGDGGNISITAGSLSLTDGAEIDARVREASDSLPGGNGQGGNININVNDTLTIAEGDTPRIIASLGTGAIGNGGKIDIQAKNLVANNGGQINAITSGRGNAGEINIKVSDTIIFDNKSGVISNVNSAAVGDAGTITIITDSLNLANEALISSGVVFGQGNGGEIFVSTNSLNLTNMAIIDATTFGQGNASEIEINANFVNLNNNAIISNLSTTNFNAGNIILNIANFLQATDSTISTLSIQSSGGNLTITSGDIQLRGDSNLITSIFSGNGNGGNITINADSVIAFNNSDIFASAPEGQGGNITLNTPAFFAENFTFNSLIANPDELFSNDRADVNATGAVSGSVSIPDVSFIQNSLTELANNSINTDELVANSCVVPAGERSQGKFIITGSESLPVRPGDNLPSKYSTGEVRGASEDNSSWQTGDPIVEAQDAYRLADGEWVLSRECPQ